jgi:hypothetical protein
MSHVQGDGSNGLYGLHVLQFDVMAPHRIRRLAPRRGPIKPRSNSLAHSFLWPHVGRCSHAILPSPHGPHLAVRDLRLIVKTSQSSLRCAHRGLFNARCSARSAQGSARAAHRSKNHIDAPYAHIFFTTRHRCCISRGRPDLHFVAGE